MQRLLLVYNPNSSQYIHVRNEILDRITNLPGFMIGKFEIKKTDFDSNVTRLIKVLKDGDLVLAAGGDATADVSANAILESDKNITLAVLPYGNFNDLARTLGTMKFEDIFGNQTSNKQKFYPLDVVVDGKHWRYATCYTTIGMTAEAVKIFDEPKIRQNMQKGHKSSWRSYLQLASWYFKNRHRSVFLPEFKLNGVKKHPKTSDYAAVNGKSMSRVMKGGDDFLKPKVFRSETERTISFPRLFVLMAKSVLRRVPGEETTGDILDFEKPSTISIQAEGEYETFVNVSKVEIKKTTKFLKVVTK